MNRILIIGIAGLVVLLAAVGLNYWLSLEEEPAVIATAPVTPPAPRTPPESPAANEAPAPESAMPSPTPAPTQPVPPAPAEESPVAPSAAPDAPASAPAPAPVEPPPQVAAVPSPAAPAPEAAVPETPAPVQPEFDIVRVAPTGDLVVAGRAAPGAVVTVYDDGRPLGQIRADGRGEWVFLPDEPLPPGSRELSLSSRLGDGEPVWSESVVVVVVPEPGRDIAGRETEETPGALAVEVPRSGFEPSQVLQQPPVDTAQAGAETPGFNLSVDVLDYDEAGNLGLAGKANPGSDILVYLDNGLLAAAPVGPDGGWRIVIERPVAPGLYTLRIDEIANNQVAARIEFPFERARLEEVQGGPLLVVVQPGNSLWRIARRTLGEGTRYTVIYQANRDRIRDPDLIYPGQVFEVPRTN